MAKFNGLVGYAVQHETAPGVWTGMTERTHYGDIIRNARRLEDRQQINEDITLNNQISIIADPYANTNYFAIRYVKWMGAVWTVTSVEVQRPRLLLTIGGLYHGEPA